MSDKALKIPTVGQYVRGLGRLVEIIDADPPPPPVIKKDYIFEEITATYEVRLNGTVLDTGSSYWDFGGLEDSVTEAISEAKAACKRLKVTKDSDVEIVVVRKSERRRKQPSERGNANNYEKDYLQFDSKPFGCCRGMLDEVRMEVWSSKRGYLTNAKNDTKQA